MILVDIFVPSLDKTYDFQLNEDVPVDALIDEICEMIGQKEHSTMIGSSDDVFLCSFSGKRVLDRNKSLYESGINTGESLVLV